MGKPRTFKEPTILREMLFLRSQGWSIKDLGFKYNCDHTSVRKACLRNGLSPRVQLLPNPVITFRVVHIDFDGQRINQGKNYKEYLLEAQKRRTSQPTFKRYTI